MEHHVYFWLNEEHQSEAQRREFEAGLASLLEIPACTGGGWGFPSGTESRDVVDQSWHYGLSLHFADVAGHDAYQVHPVHQAFVSQFRNWWDKVEVRDLTLHA